MKILKLLNVLLVFFYIVKEGSAGQCKESDNAPWSYDGENNGPSKWGDSFPKCNGESQTPIDIKSADIKKDSNLKHLEMTNYDKPVDKADIINNGHTATIFPKDGVIRTIPINGETYQFIQLHFHWGSRSNRGSEHLFNSKAYEMEVHFVHANDKGDIAVVAVLCKESNFNNSGFKAITEVLPQIKFKNETAQLKSPLNLSRLLPTLPLQIFRYSGSYTTPDCSEGIPLSVARYIIRIGKQQLKEFRSLFSVTSEEDKAGCHLQDNFRPVQPLNGRTVTLST